MMTDPRPLILLAGTLEARLLGDALAAVPLAARAVITEPPKGRADMKLPQEMRHFEDAGALAAYLEATGARGVIDASHGFDGHMTRIGFDAARALGLPHLRLARRIWHAAENPRWRQVPDVAAAMALVPPGARVFSATGWDSLPGYARFPGAVLLMRQTRGGRRDLPFDFVEPVFCLPPFSVESERQLFEGMGVDLLICRNLGGRASRPKLDAAAALGLDVILVDPPPAPEGMRIVHDVAAAANWASAL